MFQSPKMSQRQRFLQIIVSTFLVTVFVLGLLGKYESPAVLIVVVTTTLLLYLYIKTQEQPKVLGEKTSTDLDTQLFETEILYTELYKNSPVPYLIIDMDGIVVSANLAAKRFLGITKETLVGIQVGDYIKADTPEHQTFLFEKFRNGIAVSDELVTLNRVDGSEAWALLSLFVLARKKTTSLGLLTLVDITKQKQIEQAKTEFVSLASHQLRTPLAGIAWSAELLQINDEHTLSEQQKRYVDRLLMATKRMSLLVDDFLRVSRFELGTFVPEYVPLHMEEVCSEVLQEQAEVVAAKQLEVELVIADEVKIILSDCQLLRMIVTNLTSNAIKYTGAGGQITITFTTENHRMIFSVRDTGIGIPVTDHPLIFQKLFRASNAAKAVPDGNGLGLYIVKEAVSVLKGTVSFTSAEHVGTTFSAVLPLLLPSD